MWGEISARSNTAFEKKMIPGGKEPDLNCKVLFWRKNVQKNFINKKT